MSKHNDVNRAVEQAGGVNGPQSWSEARSSLFGGSTRRTAQAAGVSERSVQRWIAAEEGRGSQSRTPRPSRLAGLNRKAALQRVASGEASVSFDFAGDLNLRAGGRRGRQGRAGQQRRTTGWSSMDPEAAQDWARAELEGDPDADRRLSEAMFGPDSDYAIPPSPDYPALARIARFNLRLG